MRISNVLVTSAVIVTLVTLVVYDFFIRQVYTSGDYKIPYYHYTNCAYRDFDRVDVLSSTIANVKFIQGPFSVRLDPEAADYVKITQQGKRLSVSVIFPGNYRGNSDEYTLIISCPSLRELNTSATWHVGEQEITDTVVSTDWRMRQVSVEGFTQDSFHISQDYASTVVLKNNRFRSLTAILGESRGSGPDLSIRESNHIDDFSVTAINKARFILENAVISNLRYSLADSAKIMVSGNAQHLLTTKNKD